MNLTVSEIFRSFQGEGPNIGKPSTFLRLGGCNLHCIWCDTAYTWRFSDKHPHVNNQVYNRAELETHTIEAVHTIISAADPRHLVITGGEPLLQAEAVSELISLLYSTDGDWTFEIETAGTLPPIPKNFLSYSVSPKLNSSGNSLADRYKRDVLKQFEERGAAFKFVVSQEADFTEIDAIVSQLRIARNRVYIMPEAVTAAQLSINTCRFFYETFKRGYNLTTRLQVIAFDNKRGV
jgi:7-carboxy-7-deazaguanine synthase